MNRVSSDSLTEIQKRVDEAIPKIAAHFRLAKANVDLLRLEVRESFQAKRVVIAIARTLDR